jgi:lipopolysaccharide/colanic/teichoic acid biosynthesis glycosyltransferase
MTASMWNRSRGKRAMDVGVATTTIAFLWPVGAATAIAIILCDGRPVFFRQRRLGRNKRPFVAFKFRTMRDGQVTTVGRWLRGTGLDELPQLVHVLRGDMSLVGPRPLTTGDVARLGWNGSERSLRWWVRPGLTGPGQLRLRGPCHARITWQYDRSYVERATFVQDVSVLAASGAVTLFGKAAVRRSVHAVRHGRRPTRGRSPRGLS